MKCPNCKQSVPESSRFCTYCGARIEQSEEKKSKFVLFFASGKKKKIAAAALVLILASGLALFPFLSPISAQENYQETISEGEKYLFDLDYEKAEEYFQKAKKIEPKKPEPYEKLYEVYLETRQEEKADEIQKEAEEKLPEEKLEDFKANTDSIKEEYDTLHPDYVVVSEIGDLDRPPVDIKDSGWLLFKNGTITLMNYDGTMASSTSGNAYYVQDRIEYNPTNQPYACLYTSVPNQSAEDGVIGVIPSDKEPISVACYIFPGGGTNDGGAFILDDNDQIDYITTSIEDATYQLENLSQSIMVGRNKDFHHDNNGNLANIYSASAYQNIMDSEFYIYNPALEELYGPYSKDEDPNYQRFEMRSIYNGDLSHTGIVYGQSIYGPYYAPKDNYFSIYSADGSKYKDGFNRVEVLSNYSIGAFNGRLYTVFDENLDQLYAGEFESGGRRINDLAPVKIDGTWKLIQFGTQQETDRKAEEEKKAKEEEKNAQNSLFQDIAGNYKYQWSSGPAGAEMKISPDGSFTFEKYSLMKTSPEGEESSFSGFLIPGADKNGFKTFKAQNIQMLKDPGTVEQQGQFAVTTISNESAGVPEGTEFTFYPAGTSFSLISQDEVLKYLEDRELPLSNGQITKSIITYGYQYLISE